jgi:hypothetical protein
MNHHCIRYFKFAIAVVIIGNFAKCKLLLIWYIVA